MRCLGRGIVSSRLQSYTLLENLAMCCIGSYTHIVILFVSQEADQNFLDGEQSVEAVERMRLEMEYAERDADRAWYYF